MALGFIGLPILHAVNFMCLILNRLLQIQGVRCKCRVFLMVEQLINKKDGKRNKKEQLKELDYSKTGQGKRTWRPWLDVIIRAGKQCNFLCRTGRWGIHEIPDQGLCPNPQLFFRGNFVVILQLLDSFSSCCWCCLRRWTCAVNPYLSPSNSAASILSLSMLSD